ncbi:MAG: vWA domain-containing protein [Methylococcales bacterium]
MTTFEVLTSFALGCVAVCIASELTKRTTKQFNKDTPNSEEHASGDPAATASSEPEIPISEKPRTKFPVVSSGFDWLRCALGLLCLFLQIPLIIANSYIVSLGLDVVFDRSGDILFNLDLGGWDREITDFDLIGALICLAQFTCGAALYHAIQKEKRDYFIIVFTAFGLSSLIGFEVYVSFLRGLWIETVNGSVDPNYIAFANGLGALGCATTEVVCGVFAVEYFVGSLLATLIYAVTAPFRFIADWLSMWSFGLVSKKPSRDQSSLLTVLGQSIDAGIMSPLRAIDEAVLKGFQSLTNHNPNRGGAMKPIFMIMLVAILLITLPGCDAQLSKPKAGIAWITALDTTDSVQPDRFAVMRDRMIPELVLSRFRPGDTLHFIDLSQISGDKVKVFSHEGPKHRLAIALTVWYKSTIQPLGIRRSKATDIVGVLDYARRIHELEAQGRRPHRVVVLILTDGKPEGIQTTSTGTMPPDIQVGFWGIDAENQEALTHFARELGGLNDQQVQFVRYSDWETANNPVFGSVTGRPADANYRRLLAADG